MPIKIPKISIVYIQYDMEIGLGDIPVLQDYGNKHIHDKIIASNNHINDNITTTINTTSTKKNKKKRCPL